MTNLHFIKLNFFAIAQNILSKLFLSKLNFKETRLIMCNFVNVTKTRKIIVKIFYLLQKWRNIKHHNNRMF